MVTLRIPRRRVDGVARERTGLPLERLNPLDELLPVFDPDIEVRETRECYRFLADLPGLLQEDLEVLVSADLLVITGERSREPQGDGEQVFVRERRFGTFSCTLPLPWGLDGPKATASLRDGVLEILLPKLYRDPPTRLHINAKAAVSGACGAPRSTEPPLPGSSPRSPVQPRHRPS